MFGVLMLQMKQKTEFCKVGHAFLRFKQAL